MRRSSYIFKENHVFIEEEDNPSNSSKVVIVEEELDGIDIDGIGNAVDLQTLLHFCFFSMRVFFYGHWRLAGQQGKGGDQFLFHPLTNIQTIICNFACEMTITHF